MRLPDKILIELKRLLLLEFGYIKDVPILREDGKGLFTQPGVNAMFSSGPSGRGISVHSIQQVLGYVGRGLLITHDSVELVRDYEKTVHDPLGYSLE